MERVWRAGGVAKQGMVASRRAAGRARFKLVTSIGVLSARVLARTDRSRVAHEQGVNQGRYVACVGAILAIYLWEGCGKAGNRK